MSEYVDAVRAQILKLCAKEFKTPAELAMSLDMSVNTVRANYVYKMVREGLLVKLYKGSRRNGQAYRKSL